MISREIILEILQPMCLWYLNDSDRQTDRHTV